jgi:hypothetical protein
MTPRHDSPRLPDDGERGHARRVWRGRATGNRSRWVLLVAGVAGLCAIATGVSLAAFSAPSGHAGMTSGGGGAGRSPSAGAPGAAQPQVPVASGRATAGPGLTSAGIAKSALRWAPGRQHQMLLWKKGRGGAALSAVTTQLGNAMQAGGVRLYPELRQACVSLAASIATAQAAPAIPDSAMQHSYAGVLSGLSGAAADCRTAISVHAQGDEGLTIKLDKTLLSRALAELAADARKLYTATAEITTLH